MKKFSQEYVRSFFESEGYSLLDEYKDCKTKLEYICPKGHSGKMTFDNFSRGERCKACR